MTRWLVGESRWKRFDNNKILILKGHRGQPYPSFCEPILNGQYEGRLQISSIPAFIYHNHLRWPLEGKKEVAKDSLNIRNGESSKCQSGSFMQHVHDKIHRRFRPPAPCAAPPPTLTSPSSTPASLNILSTSSNIGLYATVPSSALSLPLHVQPKTHDIVPQLTRTHPF